MKIGKKSRLEIVLLNYVITKLSDGAENEIHIKGDFRGDILLAGNAKATIEPGSTLLSLEPLEHAKIKYPNYTGAAVFSAESSLIKNGNEITHLSGTEKEPKKELSPMSDGSYFDCRIQKAKILDKAFCFIVQDFKEISGKAILLRVNGYCDIRIKGEFTIKSPITCFQGVVLDGYIKNAVLLGNSIKNEVPDNSAYNEFSVGFRKQAINIIANVLEARNYLYLWIYAHHKVVYYANFLIPVLAKQILRQAKEDLGCIEAKKGAGDRQEEYEKLCRGFFPAWQLSYDNIQFLDDGYLWTGIKNYYYKYYEEATEWTRLCDEMLSRKYKASLYKSLAEFDLLFESFTDAQKQSALDYLCQNIRQDMPNIVQEGEFLAGYLSEAFMGKLRAYGDFKNISNMIFIDASYKSRLLDAGETFIEMEQGNVASISEILLLAERITQSNRYNRYFYLYYDTDTKGGEERKKEGKALKEAVVQLLEEAIGSSAVVSGECGEI